MPSGDKYFIFTDGQYGYPIASFAAQKVFTATGLDSTKYIGSEGKIFQQDGSDTSGIDSGYRNNGTPVAFVLKGAMPTKNNCFASLTSPGRYPFKRTSSGITIGSTTYTADKFRDNVVPSEIVVYIVAGGGGGGGKGSFSPGSDKDGFYVAPGGAGGGGAGAAFRFIIPSDLDMDIEIGKGGNAGTSHDGDAQSTGDSGSAGGYSGFRVPNGGAWYMYVAGGGGGTGGKGETDSCVAGNPGQIPSSWNYCGFDAKGHFVAGSPGNYAGSITLAKVDTGATFKITEGTGASTDTFGSSHSNSGTNWNKIDNSNPNNCYFSGGCSIAGDGDYFSGGGHVDGSGYGGGGSSGKTVSDGTAGVAYFYY